MNTVKMIFLGTIALFFALGCGGTLDPCVNITCPSGQACVVVNGDAVCQTPDDNQGNGQEGDTCESDNDCAPPLTCQAFEGVLVCGN